MKKFYKNEILSTIAGGGKCLIICMMAFFLFSKTHAQNSCSNATELNCNLKDSLITYQLQNDSMSKWFKFTACDDELIFGFYAVHSQNDSVPIGFDSIAVYTGNCQNLAHVQTFTNNSVTLNLIENNDYFIKIYPKFDNPEFYNIKILIQNIILWNCMPICNDLVINGDFETTSNVPYPLGANPSNNMDYTSTNFSSSFNQYTITGYSGLYPFLPTGPGGLTSDASLTGDGNFLYLDAPDNNGTSIAWEQNNIPVVYGKNYQFSFFVKQLIISGCSDPAKIKSYINNQQVGSQYIVNHLYWNELCYSWTPPSPSVQTISLRINITGGQSGIGYDMGIDNIRFGLVSADFDISGPNEICENDQVTLSVTNLTGQPPFNYLWSTGSTNPSISFIAQTSATYSVTVTDANGCEGIVSHFVTVNLNPDLPEILGPFLTCITDSEWEIVNYNQNYLYDWFVLIDGDIVHSEPNGGQFFSYDWMAEYPLGGSILVVVKNPGTGCTSEFEIQIYPCCDQESINPHRIFDHSVIPYDVTGSYSGETIIINGDVIFDGNFEFQECNFYLAPFSTLKLLEGEMRFIKSSFENCRDTVWKEIQILDYNEHVMFDHDTIINSVSGIVNDVGRTLTVTKTNFYNNYLHGIRLSNFVASVVYISGNIFTCTDPADMLYPYNNLRSEKGILLLNNYDVNSGYSIYIGNENLFSELLNGIYSINSDINVEKNSFVNINFSERTIGGIYTDGSQIFYQNTFTAKDNYFENCIHGIWAKRNINSEIQENTFTICDNGIAVRVEHMGYFNDALINNNTITDYLTGIFATRNNKATTYITENTISWASVTFGGTGILVTGGKLNTEAYFIEENEINRPALGIRTLNLFEPKIIRNNIDNLQNYISQEFHRGIFLTNCERAVVSQNVVRGFGLPTGIQNIGIHFEYSINTTVVCNELDNLGSCIRATGICTDSKVHTNELWTSFEGLSLTNSGLIGQQGTPISPSGNMWMPGLNNWGFDPPRAHWTYGSDGSYSVLYVKSGATTGLTPGSGGSDSNSPFVIFEATGQNETECIGTPIITKSVNIDGAKQLINEMVYFPENPYESNEWAKTELIRTLPEDSVAMTDPDIQSFLITMETEPKGIADEVHKMIEVQNYEQARMLNLSVQTITQMEATEKQARNLQIEIYETDTITSDVLQQLENLAVLCPFTHGQGVYIARSLLAEIYPDSVFSHICESDPSFEIRSSRPVIKEHTLKVYPNPANDLLCFEILNINSDMYATVEIADLFGRKILTKYSKIQDLNVLNVSSLSNGCYLLHVRLKSGISLSEKVCIVR